MSDLLDAIPIVRESVVAVLRIHMVDLERMKKGKLRPARFNLAPCGSAFCISANRYLITAHHVLNNEQRQGIPRISFMCLSCRKTLIKPSVFLLRDFLLSVRSLI